MRAGALYKEILPASRKEHAIRTLGVPPRRGDLRMIWTGSFQRCDGRR